MTKLVTYGKTFGRFYEVYRMFCRATSKQVNRQQKRLLCSKTGSMQKYYEYG